MIAGMTKVFLNLLGTCIVRTQGDRDVLNVHKKFFHSLKTSD